MLGPLDLPREDSGDSDFSDAADKSAPYVYLYAYLSGCLFINLPVCMLNLLALISSATLYFFL